MKKNIRHRVSLLLLICFSTLILPFSAAAREMRFERVLDLSHESTAVLQDRDGFLWLGSSSLGLWRFDGYETTFIKSDSGKILFDNIHSLLEDDAGHLWIGYQGEGLTRYDKTSGTATHYLPDSKTPNSIAPGAIAGSANQSDGLVQDAEGHIWIAFQRAGLDRLDPQSGVFTHFTVETAGLASNSLNGLSLGTRGELFLAYRDAGLGILEIATGTLQHISASPRNAQALSSNKVVVTQEDTYGNLWIGTNDKGLNFLDRSTGQILNFRNDERFATPGLGDGGAVESLALTPDGRILIGTQANGLFVFQDETFVNYPADNEGTFTLPEYVITDILPINDDLIFVHSTTSLSKFDAYSLQFEMTEQLNGYYVEDRSDPDILWIGAVIDAGLYRWDRRTDERLFYRDDGHDPLFEEKMRQFFHFQPHLEDSLGNLWIGIYGGFLSRFDKDSMKLLPPVYTHNPDDPASMQQSPCVRAMVEDVLEPGVFWLGFQDGGVDRFDSRNGVFTHYLADPEDDSTLLPGGVWTILQEPDGTLWFGSMGSGVSRFDRQTQTFTRYSSTHHPESGFPGSLVNSNFIDSVGRLWFATGAGLVRYERERDAFTVYGSSTDWPTSTINAVQEESPQRFWLGTDQGLLVVDPRNGELLRHYTKDDGLPDNVLYEYDGSFKTYDGIMFFSSFSGTAIFAPEQIHDNPRTPNVFLTSLTRSGDPLPLEAQELRLGWQENFFEFKYVALNYTKPQKNQYQFYLEGYDKEWYHAGTMRQGRYSNLPGGEYTLRVRGSNNDGVWCAQEQEVALRILVEEPFWKTAWFYAILVTVSLGIIFGFFLLYLRQVEARNQANLLTREMDLARQIQTAILPKEMQHDDLEIEAAMIPAEKVGGDYYDVLYDKDGHLWIGIGDVSGHGMTPGLIMMMAQTIKTTIISTQDCSPKDVVNIVNQVLFKNVHERLGEDHFMTFTTLKYLREGRFQHAGAHLSLIVHRRASGICDSIETGGTWLNCIPDISHATHNAEFRLEVGDTLVLYTDGLTEARSPQGELLDIQRFIDIVTTHAQQSPAAMRDAILEDTLAWCDRHRGDDMSLVVVRRVK